MAFNIVVQGNAWFTADGIVLHDDSYPGRPQGGTLPFCEMRRIGWVTDPGPWPTCDTDYVAVEMSDGVHVWCWAFSPVTHGEWNEVLARHFPGAAVIRGLVAKHPAGDKDSRYYSEILWPPAQAGRPLYRLRTERRWGILSSQLLEPTPGSAPAPSD